MRTTSDARTGDRTLQVQTTPMDSSETLAVPYHAIYLSLWVIATKTRCHDTKHPFIHYHKQAFNPIHRSTAWWADKAKGLFALTEEGELGMMNSMVTTVDIRKKHLFIQV